MGYLIVGLIFAISVCLFLYFELRTANNAINVLEGVIKELRAELRNTKIEVIQTKFDNDLLTGKAWKDWGIRVSDNTIK